MVDIQWAEPPAIQRRKAREEKYADLAAELKANPGKSALLGKNLPAATVKQIRDGAWSEFAPAGSFDAVSRGGSKAGQADVYVIYGSFKPEPAVTGQTAKS